MPEEPEPQAHDAETGAPDSGEAASRPAATDPLALLASYVQPDGRLKVPGGLIVTDDKGNERVVIGVDGRRAEIAVRVSPGWSPTGTSEVTLYAEDGDDVDLYAFPPSVGLDLATGGNTAAGLSADLTTAGGVLGLGNPEVHLVPWFGRDT
ncbi:MAG: hypothetical protein ACRDZR_02715 [Acidimicrobiales bacterium]